MARQQSRDSPPDVAEAYLALLARCLTRTLFPEQHQPLAPPDAPQAKRVAFDLASRFLASRNIELSRRIPFDADARQTGKDWPSEAETMIGIRRLDNLAF